MKKILLFGAISLLFFNASASSAIAFMCPPTTKYYSMASGDMTTNIWSNAAHAGPNCGCAPCVCSPCSVPANSDIYIAHTVTLTCDMVIGANSNVIIESGGALIITGNGSVSGTGNFVINAGGSASISGNFNLTGSGDATIDGSLSVGGNLTINGAVDFCGSGTVSVSGTVTGAPDPCFTGVLPVELVYFYAVPNEPAVDITWQTASELQNDYFSVERSQNGREFEEIMRIDGAGTSNQLLDYFEKDFFPLPGISYYRLKQTDYNGEYSYSDVVAVKRTDAIAEFSVYPNPANTDDPFYLNFMGFGDEEVLVVLRDIKGQEVYSKVVITASNQQIVAFDPEGRLAPGTYLVTASSNDKLYSQKVMVR